MILQKIRAVKLAGKAQWRRGLMMQTDVQLPMETTEDWQQLQRARKQEQFVCK
jgi:hypothetical protein